MSEVKKKIWRQLWRCYSCNNNDEYNWIKLKAFVKNLVADQWISINVREEVIIQQGNFWIFFLGTTVIDLSHLFQEIPFWLLTVTLLDLKNLFNLCMAKLRGRVEPTRVMTGPRCKDLKWLKRLFLMNGIITLPLTAETESS